MFVINDGTQKNEFIINFDCEKFYGGRGSFNVIAARVLGISYPDYLRLCRDSYGATIRGKEGYSYPVFKTKPTQLVGILNKNWRIVEKALS